jgi:hypothetical protein
MLKTEVSKKRGDTLFGIRKNDDEDQFFALDREIGQRCRIPMIKIEASAKEECQLWGSPRA